MRGTEITVSSSQAIIYNKMGCAAAHPILYD